MLGIHNLLSQIDMREGGDGNVEAHISVSQKETNVVR